MVDKSGFGLTPVSEPGVGAGGVDLGVFRVWGIRHSVEG